MEVHHQTHSDPAHGGTSRKKFTHFLWEFLMLFLAVFCGFLAENFREHQVDKNREREYIVSMIEDLESDTAALTTHSNQRLDRKNKMDSLTLLLGSPDYVNHTADIYYYARWVPRNTYFYSTDRTMQQLKNAGGMRLISSKEAAGAIAAYDAQLKLVQTQNYSLEANDIAQFMHMMTAIFNGNIMDQMYGDSLISRPTGNPPLLTTDRKLLDQLVSELHFVKSLNNRNIFFENKLKTQAIITINTLKREYHLQ